MKTIKGKISKRNTWIISAVIGLVIIGIGSYEIYINIGSYEVKQLVSENPKEAVQQAAKIEGIRYSTGLTGSSAEDDVLNVMNKMCHQKIEASEKWGAIPMIPDTINAVYTIVEASKFTDKEELLQILTKWKNNDFSSVDSDHNTVWQLEGGTVGKATGIATPKEEAEFILLNFGSKLTSGK